MNELKCSCGRTIPQRRNSTIQNKKCPKCTLLGSQAKKTYNRTTIYGKTTKYTTEIKTRLKTSKKGSNYLELADTWFSRYIRVKYSILVDGEFYCKDIITGKYYRANNIDNGHFYSRYHMATRYEESNCRPQNRSSNRFRGEADKKKFQDTLIKVIGQDEFDRITKLAHSSEIKYGEIELKEIANKYRKLTNEIVKRFGGKKWW